jgi:hypothetical protein
MQNRVLRRTKLKKNRLLDLQRRKPRPGLRGPVPPMPRTDSVGKPLLTLLFSPPSSFYLLHCFLCLAKIADNTLQYSDVSTPAHALHFRIYNPQLHLLPGYYSFYHENLYTTSSQIKYD